MLLVDDKEGTVNDKEATVSQKAVMVHMLNAFGRLIKIHNDICATCTYVKV